MNKYLASSLLLIILSTNLFATEYKFGVMPWQRGQTEDDIYKLYKPMLDWLSEQTGHDFIIVSTKK